MGCGDCGEIVVPQLGLLEFVGELWRVVAGCGELWQVVGAQESTGLVMRLKNLLPALKVVVGSPPYEAKYEDSVVPDHKGDSDDEYEKKDRRTMNEILLESKEDLIQDQEMVMFLDKLIECLMSTFQLLRLDDGSQICAGEIWRQAWKVQEHIAKFDEVDGLENISALWSKRWKQFHHPAYSLAYVCNPRHFGCDQLEDASVKKDVETMLKRFFPDRERRGHVINCSNEQIP